MISLNPAYSVTSFAQSALTRAATEGRTYNLRRAFVGVVLRDHPLVDFLCKLVNFDL